MNPGEIEYLIGLNLWGPSVPFSEATHNLQLESVQIND